MFRIEVWKLFLLVILIPWGCRSRESSSYDKVVSATRSSVSNPASIIIVPLGNSISDRTVNETVTQIKKFVTNVSCTSRMSLPASAYYKPRNRYRADSLIHWMHRLAKKDQILVGVTDKDISATVHGVSDWGVMGLGYRPGNACVSSTYRLKGKQDQFWKIVIHELGHTVGLPHCKTQTCLMRDSEGRGLTGKEVGFCNACAPRLRKVGWRL